MKENNEILKESTASESDSERIDDTEKRDKSVHEREEDNVTKIIITDQLKKADSFPETCLSDRSKREIKMSEEVGDMVTTERRQCRRSLRNIIDEQEHRREELDKMKGDLRQRLGMLECSIPAVMVWNIWRKSQGAPVCKIKRILEKQFKDARELSCRSTPSCHYDCRIREIEAERKLALKKVEKARTLWSEKLATLEERKRKLDEARRIQEEQKSAIERLNEETKVLREAMEEEEPCQCGDTQCKHRHLDKISSAMSIESGDVKCLEKLQRLAEEEVITKREIAELERREEAYMRTLQQADELCSKMEGDAINATNGLQEQLNVKTAANQELANRVCELEDELEKCRAKLTACRTELEKFRSIEKIEAATGRDDDTAKEEANTKRKIAELERREEAYARTLQQADELRSKIENDAIDAVNELQEQLNVKTAANRELADRVRELENELEICRARLAACETELGKLQSVEKIEATTGRDDDVAKLVDKEVAVRAKMVHRSVGGEDDVATVKDSEVLAKIEVADAEALVKVDVIDADTQTTVVVSDKLISVKPDLADFAVDRPTDLVRTEDAGSAARPEDIAYERKKFEKVREYLSQLESLEELYENDGVPCAPDFACNDAVSSLTDVTNEERTTLSEKYTTSTEQYIETVSDEERENQFKKEPERKERYVDNNVEKEEEREDGIPGAEIKRKVVENVDKRVTGIDVSVKENVTPSTNEEKAADDRLVTMPKNQSPEVNKIETDQGIVIKRETILSWIDAIDAIRTTAAVYNSY
ncbi:myosin heavy chain, non-muscle [Cardiocondyla obscurior]|uniref:myosin heavy chain, non-muscle n=1 Tax=Cardiocondyla obscurior TaxID=286306 RepID=UPI0039657736